MDGDPKYCAYFWCISFSNAKPGRIFWSWLTCVRTSESWPAIHWNIYPCAGMWLDSDIFSSLNHIFYFLQVVLELNPSPSDPPIEVIAQLSPNLLPTSLAPDHSNEPKTFVALRQGRHLLTTFHPELTNDNRFHEYFIKECVIGSRWSISFGDDEKD